MNVKVRRRMINTTPFYLLVLPAFILLAIWFYYPVINSMRMAFYDWDGFLSANYVGWSNFKTIFADKYFWMSVRNMAFFLLFGFTFPFLMPFLTAELICSLRCKGVRTFYRLVFLLPSVVPAVVSILLWRFIYDNSGPLNRILTGLGLDFAAHNWLVDPRVALLAVMFVGFPFAGGTAMLIYTAGLENIPSEIYDSAKMDGVNTWRRILHIDIPFSVPSFRYIIITGLTGIFANFVVVLLLTNGGPLFRTTVPGFYLYDKAFGVIPQFGMACAVGLLLILFSLALAALTQRYLKSDTEYYAE